MTLWIKVKTIPASAKTRFCIFFPLLNLSYYLSRIPKTHIKTDRKDRNHYHYSGFTLERRGSYEQQVAQKTAPLRCSLEQSTVCATQMGVNFHQSSGAMPLWPTLHTLFLQALIPYTSEMLLLLIYRSRTKSIEQYMKISDYWLRLEK